MLLKKQVKGGVLLYALLLLAIFSLVLQFYLHRQLASGQLTQAAREQATAYLMAQLTLEEVDTVLMNKHMKEKQEWKQLTAVSRLTEEKSEATPIEFQDKVSQVTPETTQPDSSPHLMDQQSDKSKKKAVKNQSSADKKAVTNQVASVSGNLSFGGGQSSYRLEGGLVVVQVKLDSGKLYHYRFPHRIPLE